jgi:DNA polymerase
LYNYATDPSTKALMLGWAIDEGEVQMWLCEEEPVPKELYHALNDPLVQIVAFNSAFERYIFKFVLGVTLPVRRFQDPQASARYLSLPASLEDVSIILGLPRDYAKEADGKRLINIFCMPSKRKKKRGEPVEYYFRDKETDPEDWAKFIEYCRQDVVAEREVMRREVLLGVMPLPPKEREVWIFDQTVNDRGMPTNVEFVTKAFKIAGIAKKAALDTQNKLTGLANANSGDQLIPWLTERGYAEESIEKDFVASELKNNTNLTPLCREVLLNRQTAASTSYTKFATILRQVSPDKRLRNLFTFMGSARCGRWSSTALQFHNMARPDERFEDEDNVNMARAMVMADDYEAIEKQFGHPTPEKPDPGAVLSVIKSLLRTAFETQDGNEFAVADENAIETRVGAWVSGCQPLLDVFHKGRDPYIDFAMKTTQIPYETLEFDLKNKKDPIRRGAAKKHRQQAKPGVLGCVYRMGAATLREYAEGYGVVMSLEQAQIIVDVFRESYKEIVQFWYILEEAVDDVLKGANTVRNVGPNGCIKIDKIPIRSRHPILRIQLPSGRYLHYMDARIESTKMPWTRETNDLDTLGVPIRVDVYKPTLVYAGQDQKTHGWGVVTSHGGKVFENIVQGIARDVLAHVLLKFENERGLPICGHVHDEGVTEKSTDPFAPGVREMEWEMSQPIYWAPGLPLKGDGFESTYYHK